jgi:hypothetical protein
MRKRCGGKITSQEDVEIRLEDIDIEVKMGVGRQKHLWEPKSPKEGDDGVPDVDVTAPSEEEADVGSVIK